ncbi:hypothetical protein [Chitinophaga pinensis]
MGQSILPVIMSMDQWESLF